MSNKYEVAQVLFLTPEQERYIVVNGTDKKIKKRKYIINMKMYKSLSIVVAMLGVSLSIASASDIQEKKDIAEIVKQSENFKNTDPYFAQWLKGQAVILENILTDIDVDSKSGMPDSTIQT